MWNYLSGNLLLSRAVRVCVPLSAATVCISPLLHTTRKWTSAAGHVWESCVAPGQFSTKCIPKKGLSAAKAETDNGDPEEETDVNGGSVTPLLPTLFSCSPVFLSQTHTTASSSPRAT